VKRILPLSIKIAKKRLMAPVLAVTAVSGITARLVHPFGEVKPRANAPAPLLRGSGAGPSVVATFERACQNCHSNRTEWPWYSYVPPVSWMIEKDVAAARKEMNLSEWQAYSIDDKVEKLAAMDALVRNHVMPPPRYILLHPEARLDPAAIDRISRWTHQERGKLNTAASE